MTDTMERKKDSLSVYGFIPVLWKSGKAKTRKYLYALWIFIIAICVVISLWFVFGRYYQAKEYELTEEVLRYRPVVEKYAKEYEIEEYVPYLLAIMQVESAGIGEDVMQCSESLGLEPNSLEAEESIDQGCRYFSELLQIAAQNSCDMDTVIQAYNYGIGYLYYIAENGNRHTPDLAEQFAKNYSNNKKVEYNNPIAVKKNGGWRYGYGNMFYTLLVGQYVTQENHG